MNMMALDSAFLLPSQSHQSLLDWDQLSSFGVFDFHHIMSSGMESPSCSDASIEYLQDSITCSKRESCKRRKKELSSLNEPNINMADYEDLHYLFEDFWNSSPIDPPSTLTSVTPDNKFASDDMIPSVLLESPNLPPQIMTPDCNAEINSTESHDLSTGSKPSFTRNIFILSPKGKKKKRPTTTSVVHPFVAVKPAGIEGNMTLEDINRRLLMRPARPVPHPVGEFACVPTVSVGEPGLSGKSVVGMVRIQTRGAGSVTIIRTKG